MEVNQYDRMTISVITVSYNASDTISKTIESVLHQTYSQVEYIIIDGASSDVTYEIVCSYDKCFNEIGKSYIHLSEPDRGIYDAMNKGIKISTGEWVIFLNANDCFASEKVLGDVFNNEKYNDYHCIYGNTINTNGRRTYFKKACPMNVISYKAPFIHQALFARRNTLSHYMFDLSYPNAADYDQFVHMYIDGVKFLRIDKCISVFDLQGISQTNIDEFDKEWKDIQTKYGLNKKDKVKRFIRNIVIRSIKRNKIVYDFYMIIHP